MVVCSLVDGRSSVGSDSKKRGHRHGSGTEQTPLPPKHAQASGAPASFHAELLALPLGPLLAATVDAVDEEGAEAGPAEAAAAGCAAAAAGCAAAAEEAPPEVKKPKLTAGP